MVLEDAVLASFSLAAEFKASVEGCSPWAPVMVWHDNTHVASPIPIFPTEPVSWLRFSVELNASTLLSASL